MVDPRPDLALVEGYHSPQLDVAVRLNTNESPLPPPTGWLDALGDLVTTIEWNRYPDRGADELRAKLAALHGVADEQIFVANGSNEVLQTILLAYGGPGRTALVFEPTYALHSHIARITGTGLHVADRDDKFDLPVDEAVALVHQLQPAVTFLCSPNNPTGMLEPEEAVGELPANTSGLVVVDEAYGQFAPRSAVEYLPAHPTNLIVTRTFSKTWSMAAARVGYCIAPAAVVAELDKVVLPYHLDAFKQAAAVLALDYVDEMEQRASRLVEERGRLVERLSGLPVDLWPSAANFVLFRPTQQSGSKVWQALVDRSVLVRDCDSWPRLEGCLRVTIGTRDEDDAFLDALTEVLS
jgi:histidinol-phosphate aminotransferase